MSRLSRALRAYHEVRPHLSLYWDGQENLRAALALLDELFIWPPKAPAAPPDGHGPLPVGWDDPEDVVQVKVEKTFLNPRFVEVSVKTKGGPIEFRAKRQYLWLGPKDFRPRPGDWLSARPNPHEEIGGFVLWGDYNRRGVRLG